MEKCRSLDSCDKHESLHFQKIPTVCEDRWYFLYNKAVVEIYKKLLLTRNYLRILFHRIKARTSFHWIQVPVSHNQRFRKLSFQLPQQSEQSSFLLQCTRIFRLPVRIQSSLITNTNRMGIMITAVCPDLF